MKRMQRILAVCFAVLLLATTLPLSTLAYEERTVVSVTAEDLTLIQYADGQWMNINTDDEWFYYNTDTAFTVTLSDGTSVSGTVMEIRSETGYAPRVIREQSASAPWGLGDHTVNIACADVTGSFTATVVESPVASVAVAPATAVHHVDGSYQSYTDPDTGITQKNAWFQYSVNTPSVTVTFKDGTVFEGTPDELRAETGYPLGYRLVQSYGDEWEIGDNENSVVFMGATAPFTVTVVDLIDRVEWAKVPDKRTYFYGERPDLSGGVLRIRYTDGTFEDAALEKTDINNPAVTVERLGKTVQLKNRNPVFSVTSSEMTFTVWDDTLTDTVTIRPIPTELILAADENHALTMTIDGTALSILDFEYSSFSNGMHMDWEETTGTLYTDGGIFTVTFARTYDHKLTMSLGDDLLVDIYAVSNVIDEDAWIDVLLRSDPMVSALCGYRGDTHRFDGTVTADNADNLLRMAVQLYSSYPGLIPGDSLPYYQIDRDYAEYLLIEAYGMSIDMTVSQYYDAGTDCVLVPKAGDGRSEYVNRTVPVYKDGAWRAVMYSDAQTVYTFSIGDDYRMTAFDIRDLGDVSGDAAIDMRDAFTLYSAASGGLRFPMCKQSSAI